MWSACCFGAFLYVKLENMWLENVGWIYYGCQLGHQSVWVEQLVILRGLVSLTAIWAEIYCYPEIYTLGKLSHMINLLCSSFSSMSLLSLSQRKRQRAGFLSVSYMTISSELRTMQGCNSFSINTILLLFTRLMNKFGQRLK